VNKLCGPRFSIIAWGRRRTITERNGGTDELGSQPLNSRSPSNKLTQVNVSEEKESQNDYDKVSDKESTKVEIAQVMKLVDNFVLEKQKQSVTQTKSQGPRKSRVQGGWNDSSKTNKHKDEKSNSSVSVQKKPTSWGGFNKNPLRAITVKEETDEQKQ